MSFSLPPELSLEFICGTVTSETCMLVTDAAVTAGAGLLLLKREKWRNTEHYSKAMVLYDQPFITLYAWPLTIADRILPTLQSRSQQKTEMSVGHLLSNLSNGNYFKYLIWITSETVFYTSKKLHFKKEKVKAMSAQIRCREKQSNYFPEK